MHDFVAIVHDHDDIMEVLSYLVHANIANVYDWHTSTMVLPVHQNFAQYVIYNITDLDCDDFSLKKILKCLTSHVFQTILL